MRDRKLENLMLNVAKPDETPLLIYQGIPFVHRVGSLTRIDGRCRWDDIFYEGRERSYRIHRGTTDPPCLNIFLTNRLIYQESFIVFYAKNDFCFPSRECELTLNACSGFLTDRTEQALTYINNVSLEIGFTDRRHTGFTNFRESRYYGVHWPTMQRFFNILRDTPDSKGPNNLKFLLEEQYPSDRALVSQLESKHYSNLFLGMARVTEINCLKNLSELQIDLIESTSRFRQGSSLLVRSMARFVLGCPSAHSSKISSSIVNVDSKEMYRSRLTWSSSKTG